MSVIPLPPVAGPDPGMPGHFAHHDWLEACVLALDEGAVRAQHVGALSVPVSAAVSATALVTFPVDKFSAPPVIVVSTSGTSVWVAMSSGVSATGFTATARNVDGASATATPSVNYVATQLV